MQQGTATVPATGRDRHDQIDQTHSAGGIGRRGRSVHALVRRARAEDAVLNVYNWADYIGETTIEDFQTATGIAVTYDTYSSAEEMQAKMLAGSTGYDVVDMAGLDMPRFIKAGIYEKLDKSQAAGLGQSRSGDPAHSRGLGSGQRSMACPTCGARSASPTMWTW